MRKLQFISWKSDEVAQSAESFLMYHKFGHVSNNYEYIFESVHIFVSVCVCVHSVDVVFNESSFYVVFTVPILSSIFYV